jgi:murein DD-endopeptidase MepM/ murein hydrolase activator NlpD
MHRLALLLLLWAMPAAAAELRLEGELTQGGLIRGIAPPGSTIALDSQSVRVSRDGLFVFGFGREAPGTATLRITYPSGITETRPLTITKRQYQTQRIDGLPRNMVTSSTKELARIRREGAAIAAVRRRDTAATWFAEGFRWPLWGTVTGVYGSQRILNGEPRRPHYGIDIAGPTGTPVLAPAPGIVALAEADLFFTGGTVMIDHGHGLTSVYSHLAQVSVAIGDNVASGDVLGTVGATGRVTGAHLDWRVNWFKTRLDPALLVGPMPKTN